MSTVQRKKLLTGPILWSAAKDSLVKLNPVTLMKNPVMFVVEVGTVIVLLMVLAPGYFNAEHAIGFNIAVFFILLFTVLFANFAEALAEGRGKAQADSLKKQSRTSPPASWRVQPSRRYPPRSCAKAMWWS